MKNAKLGRHADGKGFYLFVKPSGAKSWVLRVQSDGKRRDLGLGPVDLVPLAEARDKALQGRRIVFDGLDPAIDWKRKKSGIPTFETAAREYYDSIKAGFRNARHCASWLSSLEAYAFPIISAQRVNTIDAPAIHSALSPIWLTVPETARRVRQCIGLVLDYAKAKGWRADETPMRSVAAMLPRHKKTDNHFAALRYDQAAAFMRTLEAKEDSIRRLAVRLRCTIW